MGTFSVIVKSWAVTEETRIYYTLSLRRGQKHSIEHNIFIVSKLTDELWVFLYLRMLTSDGEISRVHWILIVAQCSPSLIAGLEICRNWYICPGGALQIYIYVYERLTHKLQFEKTCHNTAGSWFIHGPKHSKENLLMNLRTYFIWTRISATQYDLKPKEWWCWIMLKGLYSLSGWTSYHAISLSLEAAI